MLKDTCIKGLPALKKPPLLNKSLKPPSFGHQVSVCIKKGHEMHFFGAVVFKKFNFDGLLHKFLNGSPKTEKMLA